jgi:peptidase M28-like protein
VKLATYRVPPDARGARLDPTVLPDTSWAQFGDEVVLFGEETRWERLAERARRGAPQLQEHRASVERGHLHLVVQNGRLFQQEHPEVPVILDHGRFLLVELEPDRARRLEEENETCYGVLPLEENQVVFDVREPTAARVTPVAWIQGLVDIVSRSRLEADLTHLVSFPTRHSTSDHYADAAAWARSQLEAMNYETRSQSVTVNGGASTSVIADKPGAAAGTRNVVLIVAHLDSINQREEGAAASAPGADDNGSGSAGLLEIARAFWDHRGVHDLRFVLFGGEEQGLLGSKRYVASLSASERTRIRAVINMDMIGSLNSPSPSVLLEGAALSQRVIDSLNEAAATYTQLTVQTSLHFKNSDHVSFINAELPAVLTIEGADHTNSSVHSSNDTIDRIDYDLAVEILRMNVAFIASEAGRTS